MSMTGFTPAEIKPFEQIMRADAQLLEDKAAYQSYRMFQNYYFNSAVNELMLRKNDYTKTLTLARIEINHKRYHHATTILKLLEELGKNLGYRMIKIESILTPEMHLVAKKCNYQKNQYDAIKQLE